MLIVAAAVLGAIIGSFIATLAVRWPRGQSVARGRSACDGCGAPIGAARLIPILSFAVQRGRAACCGAPIDPIHPVGEILAAAVAALAAAVAPDMTQAIAGMLLGWLLLALALLDARRRWLPDRLTATLALLGIAAGLAGLPPGLTDRLIGGAAALLLFAFVRRGYRRLRGREGMGGGDVKLFGAIGLWLGWQALPMVVLAAAMGGLLAALALKVAGRRIDATSSLPFGIFLALAGWAGWAGWATQAAGWLAR